MTEELLLENHYINVVHAIVQGKHPPPPPQPVIPEDAPFPVFPPDSLERRLLNYNLSTHKGVMGWLEDLTLWVPTWDGDTNVIV
ncbi:hypothetical protein VKT23_013057 [Stygiomarasmius scandens]|uniref:Uncharacterized protein n=1 Tax=Marasmiellus scandens TaxID=2682957 RepID=A0ABR1J4E5_9AGAR